MGCCEVSHVIINGGTMRGCEVSHVIDNDPTMGGSEIASCTMHAHVRMHFQFVRLCMSLKTVL